MVLIIFSCASHLTSVKFMKIRRHLDLSTIPTDYLTKLTACVEKEILLSKVSQANLSPILRGIKCKRLEILHTTLSESDTSLLVKALNESVEVLMLLEGFRCDIHTLLLYCGTKKCRQIDVHKDCYQRYASEIKEYAMNKGWWIKDFNNDLLIITRNG